MGIGSFILRIKNKFELIKTYRYDYSLYRKYSVKKDTQNHSRSNLKALILVYSHSLEKGTALINKSRVFGEEKSLQLLLALRNYEIFLNHEYDETFNIGVSVLRDYYAFINNPELKDEILDFVSFHNTVEGFSGYEVLTKEFIEKSSSIDFDNFLRSRHSIRDFSGDSIPIATIRKAIKTAQQTPSSCNRQPWKAEILSKGNMAEAKKLLTGVKGFENEFTGLICVIVDTGLYIEAKERNQRFIDGGLYAMTLVYALHSLSIATCILNWSVNYDRDNKMHSLLKLPESDSIILFIGYGGFKPSFRVTRSYRYSLPD